MRKGKWGRQVRVYAEFLNLFPLLLTSQSGCTQRSVSWPAHVAHNTQTSSEKKVCIQTHYNSQKVTQEYRSLGSATYLDAGEPPWPHDYRWEWLPWAGPLAHLTPKLAPPVVELPLGSLPHLCIDSIIMTGAGKNNSLNWSNSTTMPDPVPPSTPPQPTPPPVAEPWLGSMSQVIREWPRQEQVRVTEPIYYHWWELPQISFLSLQTFCRNKHVFVTTSILLSWQKDIFCCDKHMFVTTKVSSSWQNYVCRYKYLSCDKNYTCGSSR